MSSLDDVFISLHQVALRSKGGITGLANRLGKRQQVLINKLNPADDIHQPTLGEFSAIVGATGEVEPLELLCAVHGGRFVTRSAERAETVLESLLHAVGEQGDVVRAVERAMADGEITDEERVEILREIAEERHALTVLENTLREVA